MPEAATNAPDPVAALAARVEASRREQVVLDYAHRGLPIADIAARLDIPEAEAGEKLRGALVRTLPATPEEFAALQMSRLNEALLVAFSAMAVDNLKAVDLVVRIVRALDRLHQAARPLARPVADDRLAEPAALAPAAAKLSQTVPQPFEKAQNRSRQRDRPGPLQTAFTRADVRAPTPGPGERRDLAARPAVVPPPAPGLHELGAWPALFGAPTDGGTGAALRLGGASVHALAAAGA